MSCNSAIYVVNATNTVVTSPSSQFVQVPFGSVIRRFGRSLALDGGNIVCMGSGYFDCDLSITLTPIAAGNVTVQLYQDGMAIPGATATAQGTASSALTLPVSAMIRNCGCDCNSTLSVRVNASCTVNNLAVVVNKL